MTDKTRAALIGGVTLGLLCAIPPISFGNLFCCAWVVGGGALASYLYVRRSPTAVLLGEGAEVGARAGFIGAIVTFMIAIPLSLILGDTSNEMLLWVVTRVDPQGASELRRQMEAGQTQPLAGRLPSMILKGILQAAVYCAFAALGGLLGVKLFEKRANTVNNASRAAAGRSGGDGSFGSGH
jgi:cytochrome bd-type quinol oxidase subunit 1